MPEEKNFIILCINDFNYIEDVKNKIGIKSLNDILFLNDFNLKDSNINVGNKFKENFKKFLDNNLTFNKNFIFNKGEIYNNYELVYNYYNNIPLEIKINGFYFNLTPEGRSNYRFSDYFKEISLAEYRDLQINNIFE